MLDERVLSVLARLEEEDLVERDAGVPAAERSRQVAPTTGRFLFALAASQAGIEVLEIGGSRGIRPSGSRPARAFSEDGCFRSSTIP